MRAFDFYQEVRVAHPVSDNATCRDLVGVILGIGEAPGEPALYSVTFPGHEQLGTFEEYELVATGRQFRRDDFHDDTQAIRVRLDAQGRGQLA